ncbi:MAG: hypothetical protein U0638_15630 [Phycisphaerales bacterium]
MGYFEFPMWLQITVWYVFAAGAIMLLLALFWDRSRGRLRCPRCAYDMAGAKDLKCPECGHVARSEAALRKTRRHYAWALLGLVLLSSPTAEPAWRAYKMGTYWRWTPRRALIYALPWGTDWPGYWREFERRVVAERRTQGRIAWTEDVHYQGRDLSSSERALLAERIVDALTTVKDARTTATLLEIARQLKIDAPGMTSAAMAQLPGPEPYRACAALKLARDRNYPVSDVLDAVLPAAMSAPQSAPNWFETEECLCELADYLGHVGGTDSRVVPALMQLYAHPIHALYGSPLHETVMIAFADVGPAAHEAAELLKISGRPSPSRIYAFWMVTGRFGSRCEALEQVASVPSRDYQEFAAQEIARIEPCENTIPLLKKLMSHSLMWVRDKAASSAIKLSLANTISDPELLRQAFELLKDDAHMDFDAFWKTCEFAVEAGLDPAPLEALLPEFRNQTTRIPRENVDNRASLLREYRASRSKDETFVPW